MAATAAGTNLLTIKSTINLIPVPPTSSVPVTRHSPATTGAAEAEGPGGSRQSGSSASASGAPVLLGQADRKCGPATVTVTTAKTVTVTLQASPSPSPIGAPQSSAPVQTSVVPYPIYNSSIPVGPTDTGTALISYVALASPSSSSYSPSPSPKVVQETSDGQVSVSATPVEANVAATSSPSVAINADYHQPVLASKAAPVLSAPAHPPAHSPVYSPVSTASSAPASSSSISSSGSGGSSGVRGRGLLYSYNNQQLSPDESLAQANAAVDHPIKWMGNWDSSPAPGSGRARGSTKVEFVAQFFSPDATHIAAWKTNANTPWVMGCNEPDNCNGTKAGGSCLSVQEAADVHTAYIAPLRTTGTKVTTPCTQNNVGTPNVGSDYMGQFLKLFPKNSFDAIAFHHYGPGTLEGLNGTDNPQSLAATVTEYQKLQKQWGIAELWITEGGPTDASDDMVATWLDWLEDRHNGVDRYMWNGLNSPTSVVEVGPGSKYTSS